MQRCGPFTSSVLHACLEREGLGLLLHDRSDLLVNLLVNLLDNLLVTVASIGATTSILALPGAAKFCDQNQRIAVHFGSSFFVNFIRCRCSYINGTHGGA